MELGNGVAVTWGVAGCPSLGTAASRLHLGAVARVRRHRRSTQRAASVLQLRGGGADDVARAGATRPQLCRWSSAVPTAKEAGKIPPAGINGRMATPGRTPGPGGWWRIWRPS